MVTANAENAVAAECITQGAFGYVPKPFNLTYMDHMAAVAIEQAGRTTPLSRKHVAPPLRSAVERESGGARMSSGERGEAESAGSDARGQARDRRGQLPHVEGLRQMRVESLGQRPRPGSAGSDLR